MASLNEKALRLSIILLISEEKKNQNNLSVDKIHSKTIFEFDNFVDLTDDLKEFKEQIYFDNLHLNKYGHEIYADLIYKKIFKYLKSQKVADHQ